jgi:hypothetical protein
VKPAQKYVHRKARKGRKGTLDLLRSELRLARDRIQFD